MTESSDKLYDSGATPAETAGTTSETRLSPPADDTGISVAGSEQPGDRERAEGRLFDRLVDTEKLMESLRKERDEYLDMARRAQAELANYRKRVARQQAEQLERAGEAVLARLLPLIDALDAAAAQHPQTAQPLQRVLSSILEAEGVERVEPVGQVFDPNLAEAVEHEGDGEVQIVTEVRRPGFRWRGRLLRPASVCVRSEPSPPAGSAGHAPADTTGSGSGDAASEG